MLIISHMGCLVISPVVIFAHYLVAFCWCSTCVHGSVSPSIGAIPLQNITFPGQVEFVCNASANPAPSISWTLATGMLANASAALQMGRVQVENSVSALTSGLPVTTSTLTLVNSTRLDNGLFTCRATTNVFSATRDTTLKVFGKDTSTLILS